jgi:nucleoside 2-deoxyribosyltransferase
MPKETDNKFFDRADAVIAVVNEQAEEFDRGKASASLMYATARYNAFVSACRAISSEDLASGKEEILEYFVNQYRMMLAENLDDHIENYDKYIQSQN